MKLRSSLKRISGFISRFYHRMPRRNDNAFATHIPVISAIANFIEVKKVIEFGSGTYSTQTFLNRKVFPTLERLVSFENDPEWSKVMLEAVGQDKRVELRKVDGAMESAVSAQLFENCELIFIDDSSTEEQRSRTIKSIARNCPSGPIVVIHDFEIDSYRKAASSFMQVKRITAVNPNVGICSNQNVKLFDTEKINHLIRKRHGKIQIDNACAWSVWFSANSLQSAQQRSNE